MSDVDAIMFAVERFAMNCEEYISYCAKNDHLNPIGEMARDRAEAERRAIRMMLQGIVRERNSLRDDQ